MSSRDELREAIAEALAEHYIDWGYTEAGTAESFCSCGATNVEIREHQAEVALAVLDQQGWVSPDVHALQIRAWEAKVAPLSDQHARSEQVGRGFTNVTAGGGGRGQYGRGFLPDPSAAEPATPVGTASLLGTPPRYELADFEPSTGHIHACHIHDQPKGVGRYNALACDLDCIHHLFAVAEDEAIRVSAALREVERLRAQVDRLMADIAVREGL